RPTSRNETNRLRWDASNFAKWRIWTARRAFQHLAICRYIAFKLRRSRQYQYVSNEADVQRRATGRSGYRTHRSFRETQPSGKLKPRRFGFTNLQSRFKGTVKDVPSCLTRRRPTGNWPAVPLKRTVSHSRRSCLAASAHVYPLAKSWRMLVVRLCTHSPPQLQRRSESAVESG